MQTFPERSFDVTNWIEACIGLPLCLLTRLGSLSNSVRVMSLAQAHLTTARKTLDLEGEEAVLRTRNCCCSCTQRRPYAQLTLLEERSLCFGTCAAINSDLAPMNDKNEGGIVPGCGCSRSLVQEIVQELNLRKDGRGKIAQVRQQKFMLDKISKLALQVPMLLKHFGVTYPPEEATLQRVFAQATPVVRPLSEVAVTQQLHDFETNQYEARHQHVLSQVLCLQADKGMYH